MILGGYIKILDFLSFYFVTFTKNLVQTLKIIQKNRFLICFGLIVILLMGACASSKKTRKLPKKGPIPCPVKDC